MAPHPNPEVEGEITVQESLVYPAHLSLLPFQETACWKMLEFLRVNQGCYNACVMRLGKTIQTIVVLNTLGIRKALIVVPSGLKYNWRKEIHKWSTLEPRILVVDSSDDLTAVGRADYVIVPYGIATKKAKTLADYGWEMLVADESHYLKSLKALRTKAIRGEIWGKCKYKICLSGTPFTQSALDGFSLFSKLDRENFGSFDAYVSSFVNVSQTPFGLKYWGVKNADILSRKIREKFFIRYRLEDVIKDLPKKQFISITLSQEEYGVKYTQEEKDTVEKYKAALKEAYAAKLEYFPKPPQSLATKRRLQGEAKVPAIVEFVSDLLEEEVPVVLFAYHKNVIETLTLQLTKYNPVSITGDTPSLERERATEAFQTGKTNIFIGQINAAGVGITLNRASICVLGEIDWSPSVIAQATERIRDIKAQTPIAVYYFIVENSIDIEIVETVMQKAKDFEKIVDS